MSAQPNSQNTYTTLNMRVKHAFSLTQNDLDANRAGQLTAPQKERLTNQRAHYGRSGCGGLALLVIIGFVLASGVLPTGNNPRYRYRDRSSTGVMILCGAVVVGLFGLSRLGGMTDDLHNKRVLSVSGAVKRSIRTYKRSVHYRISSGAKSFKVPKNVYDAFVDDETYILYYTPSSETLIAAEHDSGPDPTPEAAPPQSSNPLTSPSPQS